MFILIINGILLVESSGSGITMRQCVESKEAIMFYIERLIPVYIFNVTERTLISVQVLYFFGSIVLVLEMDIFSLYSFIVHYVMIIFTGNRFLFYALQFMFYNLCFLTFHLALQILILFYFGFTRFKFFFLNFEFQNGCVKKKKTNNRVGV